MWRKQVFPCVFGFTSLLFTLVWLSLLLAPEVRSHGAGADASGVYVSGSGGGGTCTINSTHPYNANNTIHPINVTVKARHGHIHRIFLPLGQHQSASTTKTFTDVQSVSGTIELSSEHTIAPGESHDLYAETDVTTTDTASDSKSATGECVF